MTETEPPRRLKPGTVHRAREMPGLAGSSADPDALMNGAELASWALCPGHAFSVRCGPNYAVTGQKAGSLGSLYEVFAVDTSSSATKLPHVGRVAALPDDPGAAELGLPAFLIVHAMVPQYPPPGLLGQRRSDGPSWQLTLYCRLSDEVRAQVRAGHASAGVELLRRFVHPQLGARLRKERLKLIMGVTDYDAPGFDMVTRRVLQSYNYKPFLSKTASSFYSTQVPLPASPPSRP
jgi:hypothetical protein